MNLSFACFFRLFNLLSRRCKLVELINLRFNLSRLEVKCRISESYQGLSFGLTTTRFEGIHSFTISRKMSVNFLQASSNDLSCKTDHSLIISKDRNWPFYIATLAV